MKDPERQLSKDNYVITIGREFGAGGRELGKLLADRLGIEFFDKRLLAEAAKRAGMATETFEEQDEKLPNLMGSSVSFSMGYGSMPWYNGAAMMADSIYTSLNEVINSLASTRPCVIVGRSANFALRNNPVAQVNLFLHAPIDKRVERILSRGDKMSEKEARSLAIKTDKLRASYYNFVTDREWGHASTYDLTIDSSKIPMEHIAQLIEDYIRHRFGIEPVRK